MLDSTESSASDAATETAYSGVAFGRWGMEAGLAPLEVLVLDHVGLNVCDSDYDLSVMGNVDLALVWALVLVPEVPGLVQMVFLLLLICVGVG